MDRDKKLRILIENFNKYVETLVNFISKISDNPLVSFYKPMIDQVIQKKSPKIIDLFTINIFMKYGDRIMNNDEEYFLNGEFSDDNNTITKIFELKKIWKYLSNQNKETIKSYMILLCQISKKYLDIIVESREEK